MVTASWSCLRVDCFSVWYYRMMLSVVICVFPNFFASKGLAPHGYFMAWKSYS
jgi:hypothetical protein